MNSEFVSQKMMFPGRVDDLRGEALTLFNTLRNAGRMARVLSFLSPTRLHTLSEDLRGRTVKGTRQVGVRTLELSRLSGSESRVDDFDAAFRPLREQSRDRFVSIAVARLQGREMPAIQVIELDGRYYVRDGHHRVAVARALGEAFIEAGVTVLTAGED